MSKLETLIVAGYPVGRFEAVLVHTVLFSWVPPFSFVSPLDLPLLPCIPRTFSERKNIKPVDVLPGTQFFRCHLH